MAENQSTIWIRAYLPEGHQAGITIAFDGIDNLPEASALQAAILAKGYRLDIPENEFIEIMSHVSRRMHRNKKDNTITPVIAFYHENSSLIWKYDSVYLNTTEQITEFENLSGMKLSDIPEYDGDTWLSRESDKAKKYIVPLSKKIKVAAQWKPYKASDGSEGETKKIQRFISSEDNGQKIGTKPQSLQDDDSQVPDGKWLADIKKLTKELYIGADGKYNPFHHNGSIQKALDNDTIRESMNASLASAMLFAHRVETEYSYTTEDIKDVLGCELGDWLKQGKTLAQAWATIRDEFTEAQAS